MCRIFPLSVWHLYLCLTSLFGMRSGNKQPLGISALFSRLFRTYIQFPHSDKWWEPWNQGFIQIYLYLSQQIGVRSSKTSQCGSANMPSVVSQGSPRIWWLSKSLLVSQIAVSVCRHDLPPCTARWVTLFWASIRRLEASPWSLYFPHWLGHCTQGLAMTSACIIGVGRINFHIPNS